jgi:hypothetical protein
LLDLGLAPSVSFKIFRQGFRFTPKLLPTSFNMDRETNEQVTGECEQFIESINRDVVCQLASLFHNRQACHLFGDPMKGRFNICFPVEFDATPDRWVVRYPIKPRVAFPTEKLRSEIATMK